MNLTFTYRQCIASHLRGLSSVTLTASILSAAVVGCSDKPPGCADSQVRETLTAAIKEAAQPGGSQKMEPAYENYFKNLKLGLTQITSEGYDQGARRYECAAALVVTDEQGADTLQVRYVVQSVEGSRGQFLVRYESASLLTMQVHSKAVYFVADSAKRRAAGREAEIQANLDRASDSSQGSADKAPNAASIESSESTPMSSESETKPSDPVATAARTAPADVAGESQARQPSFSCAGKLSATEQAICDTPALAEADAKMAVLYTHAISTAGDQAALKQQQRQWRSSVDACPDAACVADAYTRRNAELSR